MNGTIIFNDAESLARFLKEFTGSTATFKVCQMANGQFNLTFDGGF